jgi:hypothetical protein
MDGERIMENTYLFARTVLAAWLFLPSTNFVHAATVYQYTGNNYEEINPGTLYNISMSVTGSFTTDAPLISFNGDASSLITQYSYFDGINTLTELNAGGSFSLVTDSFGNITDWIIEITNADRIAAGDPYFSISSSDGFDAGTTGECAFADSSGCSILAIQEQGLVVGNPGSWTVVPIPATAYLFATGLLGLIGVARRKKVA